MDEGPEDYPRTAAEFSQRFSSEEACWRYLVALRWPSGFRCPRCSSVKAWLIARGLFECRDCGRQVSATAGTIFQDTRKPLRLWFQAMWWVVGQKHGASALGLNRVLGIGRYQTAWTWLHKLRRAMVRPGRDRLSGHVEIDETYVGGVEEGVSGRQTRKKALVAIAVEYSQGRLGRARMARIPDASASSLMRFVQATVEPGSTVYTDGWEGYNSLSSLGYRHKAKAISTSGDPAHVVMPAVHRVASLLKRWLLGTHQGAVSREHLDYYLDEYTFRFNRRTSRHRGKLFYRLLQQAAAVAPAPYRTLTKGGLRGPRARSHKR
jgi:transposase-like protein/ribosomal protein L37AE/L43A